MSTREIGGAMHSNKYYYSVLPDHVRWEDTVYFSVFFIQKESEGNMKLHTA